MPKVTPAYHEAKRREILAAAVALFAEKGFAATSMTDISAAAGVATGTPYRYFANKEALVIAVCQEGEGVDPIGTTATGTLRHLFDQVRPAGGAPHARLVAQIWGDAAVNPPLAEVITRRHASLRDGLARVLGGEEASARSEVLLAALIGYAALVATDAPVDHEGFEKALLQAVGADPEVTPTT